MWIVSLEKSISPDVEPKGIVRSSLVGNIVRLNARKIYAEIEPAFLRKDSVITVDKSALHEIFRNRTDRHLKKTVIQLDSRSKFLDPYFLCHILYITRLLKINLNRIIRKIRRFDLRDWH